MLTSRTLSRRDLLKLAIAMVSCSRMEVRASPGLSILVLGGTGFLGPHQVSAALARGHRVTVFHRGKSGVSLDPRVEQLTGDRETGNLSSLRGRRWDAVIDNCRDSPRWVAESTCLLRDSVGHYLYVSSISA